MIRSSYNRLNLKHTKKLLYLARRTIGIQDPIWLYELQILLPRLINLKSLIKDVEQNISQYSSIHFGHESELLMTLPGVGVLAASAIIGFLGDLRRFEGGRSGRKVTAFAGLAVMQHSSGQKERHWGISKAGPSLLRFYLHFAALTAIRKDGPFMQYYLRLVNGGTPPLKALVAVSAKILRTAYRMLQDKTEFNPQMVYPQNRGGRKPGKIMVKIA